MKRHLFIGIVRLADGWMIRCKAIVHSNWVIVSFIAFAVSSLVRQTELTRVATSARSLVVATGILLTTLGIGALMGWMGLLWSQGVFTPLEAVHLTQEQALALRWAISAEGKFARNLMKWNSDSLSNLECKKDVRRYSRELLVEI
jgi:hypothetical protein